MNAENFKVSAALKDIIGKELITDEFVAVFELVKNSFDAFASKVEIHFQSIYGSNPRILIVDNGKGMDYTDLKDKWLFVAYSAKRLKKELEDNYRDRIKSNRIFAGAKGVGRFSCDRLGKTLNLLTIKDSSNPRIENLFVDWKSFENVDNKEFIKIDVQHRVLDSLNYEIEHGTILEINELRDTWDREKLLHLKRSLVKLINPNQENDSSNFSIEIIANEELEEDLKKESDWEKVNGPIENKVFETLEIKTTNIYVQISEDGDYIETTMQDRGDLIYYLKEKNPFNRLKNISVYLFQLNRKAKIAFHKVMGLRSIDYGSVFMYKNGFRIYPFGDPSEDILLIDRRKQQGYSRFLGTRDLIGRIEIFGDNNELRETSSRDGGLVKTDAWFDLVDFFSKYVLLRLENYVVNIIKWGDERIDKDTGEIINPELWPYDVKMQILELISGFINSKNILEIQYDKDFLNIIERKQDKSVDKIIKNVSKVAAQTGNKDLIKEARKIESAVKQVRSDAKVDRVRAELAERNVLDINEKLKYTIGQNSFLKDSVGADTIELQSLLHHTEKATYWIERHIENLFRGIEEGWSKDNLFDLLNKISLENQKIFSFTKYHKSTKFNTFVKEIEEDIVSFVNEYISNVCQAYEDYENINIITTNKNKASLRTHFSPVDITILFDNLLNNAKKAKSKNIHFEWIDVNDEDLQLRVRDDGIGISSKIINQIFDFRFTTTKGSGIGLYNVKEIMSQLNGRVEVNPNYKIGAEFILTFNKKNAIRL